MSELVSPFAHRLVRNQDLVHRAFRAKVLPFMYLATRRQVHKRPKKACSRMGTKRHEIPRRGDTRSPTCRCAGPWTGPVFRVPRSIAGTVFIGLAVRALWRTECHGPAASGTAFPAMYGDGLCTAPSGSPSGRCASGFATLRNGSAASSASGRKHDSPIGGS